MQVLFSGFIGHVLRHALPHHRPGAAWEPVSIAQTSAVVAAEVEVAALGATPAWGALRVA